MAVDFEGGDFSNGKQAGTILQSQNGATGSRRVVGTSSGSVAPGFINKVRGMSFAFTERFEAHIQFPGSLDLSNISDGTSQYLRKLKMAPPPWPGNP